jgi:hypothetical protein
MAGGRLRRTISRWASASDQIDRDLREAFEHVDCVPIGEIPLREPVSMRGTLRTVTLRPRGGVPALEAELYDGTGAILLVWLGRRRIAGIAPGRDVQVHGRVGLQDGVKVLYNPRYELIP